MTLEEQSKITEIMDLLNPVPRETVYQMFTNWVSGRDLNTIPFIQAVDHVQYCITSQIRLIGNRM